MWFRIHAVIGGFHLSGAANEAIIGEKFLLKKPDLLGTGYICLDFLDWFLFTLVRSFFPPSAQFFSPHKKCANSSKKRFLIMMTITTTTATITDRSDSLWVQEVPTWPDPPWPLHRVEGCPGNEHHHLCHNPIWSPWKCTFFTLVLLLNKHWVFRVFSILFKEYRGRI